MYAKLSKGHGKADGFFQKTFGPAGVYTPPTRYTAECQDISLTRSASAPGKRRPRRDGKGEALADLCEERRKGRNGATYLCITVKPRPQREGRHGNHIHHINNNLINLTNTMEKNKKQFAQFVIQALIAVLTALAGVFTGCKMVG